MSDIDIRRVGPDDWEVAREIRLRALAEAPYAFGSTLEREVVFDEENWRGRLARSAWFIAYADGETVGLAVGIFDEDEPEVPQLVSMWVDPRYRGTGVAAPLVDLVLQWAADDGAPAVGLWVADGNERAQRFYERLGFVATGERQPLPSNPAIGETRLERSLRAN